MAELDVLASPYHFPLAGVHGAERRDIHDQLHVVSLPDTLIQALHTELSSALASLPGTELEAKAWRCTIGRLRITKRRSLRLPAAWPMHPQLAQPGSASLR